MKRLIMLILVGFLAVGVVGAPYTEKVVDRKTCEFIDCYPEVNYIVMRYMLITDLTGEHLINLYYVSYIGPVRFIETFPLIGFCSPKEAKYGFEIKSYAYYVVLHYATKEEAENAKEKLVKEFVG